MFKLGRNLKQCPGVFRCGMQPTNVAGYDLNRNSPWQAAAEANSLTQFIERNEFERPDPVPFPVDARSQVAPIDLQLTTSVLVAALAKARQAFEPVHVPTTAVWLRMDLALRRSLVTQSRWVTVEPHLCHQCLKPRIRMQISEEWAGPHVRHARIVLSVRSIEPVE